MNNLKFAVTHDFWGALKQICKYFLIEKNNQGRQVIIIR